jgi:hypothetical protein
MVKAMVYPQSRVAIIGLNAAIRAALNINTIGMWPLIIMRNGRLMRVFHPALLDTYPWTELASVVFSVKITANQTMTMYDENGFLEGRIQSWIKSQRASRRDIIKRAQELNRDCHRFLDGRAVDLGDGKQIATSVLFARILELYQSILVVTERGMAATTRILFRAFLEACFHFFAIHRDSTYLNHYLNQSLIQKRSLIRRIRQSESSQMETLRQAATDPLLEQTEKAIRDLGAQAISIAEVAKRAEMYDIYLTAYAVLSHAVHTGASDIDHHILINDVTKETEGFKYGPSDEETVRGICLSGMTLAESLNLASESFGEDRKALCTAHKEAFRSFLDTK